ncbi:Cthe_2314 family HEPN domain-containing protein [Paenibacillus sp. VCA1]|uniref:Cthe_2314 family HEPN domain-containing protein n=1 Tax=Paenibacillus sp. VCA1 TaxID=3039148 RepID=UPI002871E34F|nr:Cthe_2314 family HEPN domain-containing protein [Paenibacillus sp. VCA1]MDR9856753.1 Cthe_2314 family HEPN domain-containing protein [Paenibacillus sp. VCA1]
MLRTLLGEMPRQNSGLLGEAMDAMHRTIGRLQREMDKNDDPSHDFRKLDIWTRGLVSSLDELEQSWFAASFFRRSVKAGYVDDMSAEEQTEYARYVYFYKNGFIRVFSVLDKLGTVLNELFELDTAKVKEHYSYFTVLRRLRELGRHPELEGELAAVKNDYRDCLNVLRKRRNAEIHYMNAEMQDDLWQRHQGLHAKVELEDLDQHLNDLKQGLDMVCKSLIAVYRYAGRLKS